MASDNLIRTYDLTDLRRDHYLMWEVIDYGYTPRYKKAVSKFEAVSNYNIRFLGMVESGALLLSHRSLFECGGGSCNAL